MLAEAFPGYLRGSARAAAAMVTTVHASMGTIAVVVEGDEVTLPGRIYAHEPSAEALAACPATARAMVHCLYTRHHNGFVRARHLDHVLACDAPWAAPFVVQLVGEYVLPIVETIAARLDLADLHGPVAARYGRFIAANRRFAAATVARTISYWNCYYRRAYARVTTYPGRMVMARLQEAAAIHGPPT
ncbi:MAG: hypothetical protein IPL61_25105 [Myxococcales bacterium]|nr:hypothetical protein [Myxococcales bacterium]